MKRCESCLGTGNQLPHYAMEGFLHEVEVLGECPRCQGTGVRE